METFPPPGPFTEPPDTTRGPRQGPRDLHACAKLDHDRGEDRFVGEIRRGSALERGERRGSGV